MSEKPMTELLRKSGIIPKHIAEFEKWRLLPPGGDESSDPVPKTAGQMVDDLVEEIAELLDQEPTMKQTVLSVSVKTAPVRWVSDRGIEFYAVKDEMGRLIVSAGANVVRGDLVTDEGLSVRYLILEVEDIYEGDKVTAKMVTIEKE